MDEAASVTPPARSSVQRMRALAQANETRSMRSKLKREVKAGERSALPLLEQPAPELESMKVHELLLAIPKVGRVKAGKTLARCRVSAHKTLGGLSERQRSELVSLLSLR